MCTFGPIAPPGIGKPSTRASGLVVVGVELVFLQPLLQHASRARCISTRRCRASSRFRLQRVRRATATSGCEVPRSHRADATGPHRPRHRRCPPCTQETPSRGVVRVLPERHLGRQDRLEPYRRLVARHRIGRCRDASFMHTASTCTPRCEDLPARRRRRTPACGRRSARRAAPSSRPPPGGACPRRRSARPS